MGIFPHLFKILIYNRVGSKCNSDIFLVESAVNEAAGVAAARGRVAGAEHRPSWHSCGAGGRHWAAAPLLVAAAVKKASWLPLAWQAQDLLEELLPRGRRWAVPLSWPLQCTKAFWLPFLPLGAAGFLVNWIGST
jgi:hypothetical protein